MNQNILEKVDKYLELFRETRNKAEDDRVALAILQEVAKDRRMEQIREERESQNGEPPTKKQLAYLKTLGIEVLPVSKQQASALIDAATGKKE